MSKNVIVSVVTVGQDFPFGTVDVPFTYTLTNTVDGTVASQTDAATTVTFSAVPEGSYTIDVVKFGVKASQSFNVEATSVSLQVPQTVSVSFS